MNDRDFKATLSVIEEKRYAQISNESIQTWSETIGVTDLSQDSLKSIAGDATYRLQQTLSICSKFLSHSNRKKLTSEDFNRALKWMDVSPVYGYSGSEPLEWVNVPELGVHVPHDPPVNLASTALSGDIFHQPGSSYVKAKWAHVSGHILMKSESNAEEKNLSSLPLSPELTQYYRTLFSVITSPSNKLFQAMREDVGSSANIGPLVSPIIRSVMKGAHKARQKPLILRRLLLIVQALVFNPHIHLGPQNYIHDIVNVLTFSVVTERKNPQDTQSIRTLAANILLKLSRSEGEVGTSWELAVMSLSEVVGSSTRPWTQHAGALTGLMPLGFHALYRALSPIITTYYARLSQVLSIPPSVSISSAISAKDTLDAHMTAGLLLSCFVNMMFDLIKRLPDKSNIYLRDNNCRKIENSYSEQSEDRDLADLISKLNEIYFLGEDMFGSAFVLQVPSLDMCWATENSLILDNMKVHNGFNDENLLLEENFGRQSKRIKTGQRRSQSSNSIFSTLDKHSYGMTVDQVFEKYKVSLPLKKRRIFMRVKGCSTRNFEYLKQGKGTLPEVSQHPNRSLLIKYNKTRMINRMPHWTFIKPRFPPNRPCSSLKYLIL